MFQRVIGTIPAGSIAAAFLLAVFVGEPGPARADEGGVSFWTPGLYGSLAAAPLQPGWSYLGAYYHPSVSASGKVAASREVTIEDIPVNVNVGLDLNLNADANIAFVGPTYVFATPVLGGQLALGMSAVVGGNNTSLNGTLTLTAGSTVLTRRGRIDSSVTGFGDLYPSASLRWNDGAHNFMTYLMGDIPVGAYNPNRLANLGIGHGAIDAGFGYTYFNPQSGFELSGVTGFTYNFENPDTHYRNGVDWHLDWAASQFLSKQLMAGIVGYVYNQISADSGAAAFLGDNQSRVAGIGPQVGYMFPAGTSQAFLDLKGYYEFGAERRADGWNLWLTLSISPAALQTP